MSGWIQADMQQNTISETSQNFSSFRQLFFHTFQGKMLENQLAIFQHFSFGPPLETMKKKVV